MRSPPPPPAHYTLGSRGSAYMAAPCDERAAFVTKPRGREEEKKDAQARRECQRAPPPRSESHAATLPRRRGDVARARTQPGPLFPAEWPENVAQRKNIIHTNLTRGRYTQRRALLCFKSPLTAALESPHPSQSKASKHMRKKTRRSSAADWLAWAGVRGPSGPRYRAPL